MFKFIKSKHQWAKAQNIKFKENHIKGPNLVQVEIKVYNDSNRLKNNYKANLAKPKLIQI